MGKHKFHDPFFIGKNTLLFIDITSQETVTTPASLPFVR
jgi:hypothetical protein